MSGFLSFSKPSGHIMRKETVQCSQLKKMVLKLKKIAENQKIKGSLKNSKCRKI